MTTQITGTPAPVGFDGESAAPEVVPTTEPLHRPTLPAVAMAAAGVLFALYPVLRPASATGVAAADGWSSPPWLIAHLCAMGAVIAAGFGLLGLRDALAGFLGGRLASWALVAWWLGGGLVLCFFGAEAFGLHTVGRWVEQTRQFDLVALGERIGTGQVQLVVFGAGLGLLAVAGVLVALAVLRSGAMPPGAGLLFAIALLSFPPQFFAPAWVRILHGVVTALGCLVLALQLRRLGLDDAGLDDAGLDDAGRADADDAGPRLPLSPS